MTTTSVLKVGVVQLEVPFPSAVLPHLKSGSRSTKKPRLTVGRGGAFT